MERPAARHVLVAGFSLLLVHAPHASAQDKPAASPPAAGSPAAKKLPEGAVALVNGEPITRADFYARLIRKGDPSDIENVLSHLTDNHVIGQEMKRRKIEVSDSDIERKIESLGGDVKAKSQGATTLEAEMERTGVSPAELRAQLRYLIGLEAMTRADFGIAEKESVPEARMHVWLAQARGKATVKKDGLPKGVARVVNGEPVYEEEVGRELERSLGKSESRAALNELIGVRLVQARMKELGLSVAPEDLEREMVARRKQFERNPRFAGVDFVQFLQATRSQTPEQMKADEEFEAQVALKKIVAKQYPEGEQRKYFEENRALFGPLIRASHILVRASDPPAKGGRSFDEARAEIDKIEAELKSGGDFAALAAKHSEDSSKDQKGDVGYFPPKGVMDDAFASAAASLAVGKLSGPVRTGAGWHLIFVTDRKPEPSFSDVRDEVLASLARRLYKEIVQKAEITVES